MGGGIFLHVPGVSAFSLHVKDQLQVISFVHHKTSSDILSTSHVQEDNMYNSTGYVSVKLEIPLKDTLDNSWRPDYLVHITFFRTT